MPIEYKAKSQFWVSITAVSGLTLVTGVCVLIDQWKGVRDNQATMLLVGGFISVASSCSAWLFRTNGEHAARKDNDSKEA